MDQSTAQFDICTQLDFLRRSSIRNDGKFYLTEEVCLKYNGQSITKVYDNLDVLSEDYIAFCEDGKWGYLKLIRENSIFERK